MSTQYEVARAAAARRAYGNKESGAKAKTRMGLDLSPDELVRRYSPLVYRIAKRVRRRTGYAVELDDLVCEGTIGLLQAAERFDKSRETEFEHLASVRVHGAMLDSLRRLDPLSQRRRREAKKHQKMQRKLESALSRTPTAPEMAEALGMELDDYYKISTELQTQPPVSLDDMVGEIRGKSESPHEGAQALELRDLMKGMMETLGERHKLVLSLIYYNELSQKDVSQVLEVTEARISQIHKEALDKLKRKMKSTARMGEEAW